MARPKSKVTLDNAFSISRYFERIFKEHVQISSFADFDSRFEASRDFEALPSQHILFQKDALESEQLAYVQALQAWIDKYILQADWHRCLTTLRQHKFTIKARIKTLKLRADVYYDLQFYANKLGISMETAIRKVIDTMIASENDAKTG